MILGSDLIRVLIHHGKSVLNTSNSSLLFMCLFSKSVLHNVWISKPPIPQATKLQFGDAHGNPSRSDTPHKIMSEMFIPELQ